MADEQVKTTVPTAETAVQNTKSKSVKTEAFPAQPAQPEMKPTMFVVPAVMLGMRYFKIDLTGHVQELRIAFGFVVILKCLCTLYIYLVSQKSTDSAIVEVSEKGMDGIEKTKKMTVAEYDASVITKSLGSTAFGTLITCGIHYKWGNPTPLLIQCVMGPMNVYEEPLFQIHVLGCKAEGKLARPFKAPPNPMEELMGGGKSAETPAVPIAASSIDESEKRGKKDKKND